MIPTRHSQIHPDPPSVRSACASFSMKLNLKPVNQVHWAGFIFARQGRGISRGILLRRSFPFGRAAWRALARFPFSLARQTNIAIHIALELICVRQGNRISPVSFLRHPHHGSFSLGRAESFLSDRLFFVQQGRVCSACSLWVAATCEQEP